MSVSEAEAQTSGNEMDLAEDEDLDRGDELYPAAEHDGDALTAVLSATDAADEAEAETETPAPAPADPLAGGEAGEPQGAASEGGGDEQRVPRSRLNEVIAQREQAKLRAIELEAEVTRLRNQQGAAMPGAQDNQGQETGAASDFDFEEKEQAYQDAILDGDPQTAKKIRAEIRAAEQVQVQQKIDAEISRREAESAARAAQQALDAEVANVKARYPFLDIGSEKRNPDAVADVDALYVSYVNSGTNPVDALKKAVGKVAKMYGESSGQAAPQGKRDERPASAIARNVQAANAQPPRMQTGVGERASDITGDVDKMTEAQFDRLSKAELAKLRGDEG